MNYFLKPFFILIFSLKFCAAQSFTLQDTSFTNGEILVSYNVKFEIAKSIFITETYSYLDTLVIFLKLHNNLVVEVGNYFDERWSAESSRCLTCSRAEAVVEYLINKGISSNRLVSVGYNDSDPIIPKSERVRLSLLARVSLTDQPRTSNKQTH